MTILSPAEVKVLLNGLRGHSYHPIAALALATGMRRGELLALQWSDIDLAKGIIRVERSLEQTQAGLRVKPPKSKAGKRSVTIAGDAVAMPRDHLRQQRASSACSSARAGSRSSCSAMSRETICRPIA